VKAFKSAFFGTPGKGKDDEVDKSQPQEDEKVENHAEVKVGDKISATNLPTFQSARKLPVRPTLDVLPSPAKGILLTPGTGATRRKTVSFGQLADLAEDTVEVEGGKVENTTVIRNLSTIGSSRGLQKTRRREASLRRTLFEVRGTSEPSVTSHQAPSALPAEAQPTVTEKCNEGKETEDNGDITTDLKHPLSRSGQHWMNEYRRDHAKSKKEMRELIKYSQTAKSYARKRDAEALDLADKLRKAELRVVEMETRVSGLASRLTNKDQRDGGLPSNQAELLNELATQTARALRYKEKAEKCKLAVQEHGAATGNGIEASKDDGQYEFAQSSKEAPALQAMHNLQAQGPQSLQVELSNLRLVARSAESKAASLERENMALKHTLARVKQEMKAYEVRHKASQERRKRRDEKAEAQRQALKKELAQYRYGYIRKPDTVPIATSVKEARTEDGRLRTLKQHPVVDNLNLQYRGNVPGEQQNSEGTGKPPNALSAEDEISHETHTTSTKPKDVRSSLLQDSIDIWAVSVPAGQDARPTQPQARVVSLGHTDQRSKPTTMELRLKTREDGSTTNDERTKAVTADKEARSNTISTGSAAITEHIQPWFDEEVHSPELPLRSVQSGSGGNVLSRLPSSSRTSSLSGRPPLPPDRIEAAKRRLEQRYAEKDRGGGDGKENRTP
jgi:type II secretory pathway pseudopilin PulG